MKVIIVGRSGCKWCREARKLCKERKIKYKYEDLEAEANQELAHWFEIENIKTVPQVWVDGRQIGGYQELKAFLEEDS